jgi:branched-chain amino acid transport system ATP-binding protein
VTAPSAAPLLAIRSLRAAYGKIEALKGVDLDINPGEIVALIGANGAGKSSILRAITGLRPLRSGHILFDGKRLDGISPDRIVKLGIAMVPEGRRVFPLMSVRASHG